MLNINGLKRAALNIAKFGAILLVVLTALVLRGCVVRPATNYPGSHFNKGKNAVWLGVEWLNESHTDAEITVLGADLAKHQIAYVFVYASYLKADGTFNKTYSHSADFLRVLHAAQPQIKVLAWIGVPLDVVDVSSDSVRQQIAAFSGDLMTYYAFDGIHLDPEPIGNKNQNIIQLLDQTRAKIGKQAILSLATHKAWPVFADNSALNMENAVFWSAAYFHQVAQHVDQLAVMTYDSVLPSREMYRQWSRFEVIAISKAVSGTGAELLIGIPTSEEETSTHHVKAENMQSGLTGVIDGLNDEESAPDAVTGVAIYPYWETDATEWALYDKLWLR